VYIAMMAAVISDQSPSCGVLWHPGPTHQKNQPRLTKSTPSGEYSKWQWVRRNFYDFLAFTQLVEMRIKGLKQDGTPPPPGGVCSQLSGVILLIIIY